MNVHASPSPLPELDDFLSTFNLKFWRSEGEAVLERYLIGLLTELPNQNCDTMATAVPGTSEQRLQEFLTNMQWDEDDLVREMERLPRVPRVRAAIRTGLVSTHTTSGTFHGSLNTDLYRGLVGSLWRGDAAG